MAELAFTVTVHQGPDEFTIIPASRILEVPTEVRGRYDGDAGWQRDTPERLIRFSFDPWRSMPGRPFTEVLALAARLGAHLAALDEDWPTGEAHVMLLPVVDLSLMFEATPAPRTARREIPAPAAAGDAQQRVAYCAPGRTAEAAAVLERDGEQVSEIREHPWLAGYPGAVVVNPAAPIPLAPIPPAPLIGEAPRPDPRRWDYPVV